MANVSNSKVLVTNLYNNTDKHLSNKKEVDKLFYGARNYFDRNSDIVYDTGMTNKIYFTDSDKKYIIDASGLNILDIKKILKESKYLKDNWKIMNEPLNICAAMIARHFTIRKMDKELEVFLTYYSFYFYTSLYHKYLPYGAQKNIMDYTINNLSNKFLLKTTGSLYKTIVHTVMTSHDNHKAALIEGSDKGLADYISSIKVRLNNLVKNIKNEYTINHKNKRYMNYDSDNYDEDNFHLADNNSFNVQNSTESAVTKLSSYGPDMSLIKITANMNQVSENEMRNVITSISNNETDVMRRLMELILQLYLFDNKNNADEIHSTKFLYNSLEIYKKSNTNDKIILEIKSILDMWLKNYSVRYNKTNREPTLSAFRRAVYVYFVLHLQQSN